MLENKAYLRLRMHLLNTCTMEYHRSAPSQNSAPHAPSSGMAAQFSVRACFLWPCYGTGEGGITHINERVRLPHLKGPVTYVIWGAQSWYYASASTMSVPVLSSFCCCRSPPMWKVDRSRQRAVPHKYYTQWMYL